MTNKSKGFTVKCISLFLSAIMLFELSAPAYAQARRGSGGGSRTEAKRREFGLNTIDLGQLDKVVAPASSTYVARPPVVLDRRIEDPKFKEAESITFELLFGKNLAEAKGSGAEGDASGILDFEQFKAQYNKAVNDEYAASKKRLASFKKEYLTQMNLNAEKYALDPEYTEGDINAWKEQETANIEDWYKNSLKELEKVKNSTLGKVQAEYNAYKQDIERAAAAYEEEIFKKVKGKIDRIYTLYKTANSNVAPFIGNILLNTVPLFIPMSSKGQNMLDDGQKKIIYDLALKQLQQPVTLQTKSVNDYISAITVVGYLGKQGDGGPTAIKNMLYSSVDAPQFHPYLLLTSVSALLAVKDYYTVRDIISYFTYGEQKIEAPDILSIAAWVDNIQMIHGRYLGNSSNLAQYQMEDGSLANAYTDIALMLAEEGSPQSLDILKTFGADKCVMTLDFNFKDTYSPSCGGIKPFLVGALISGKAGVKNYAGPFVVPMEGQRELLGSGTTRVVTKDDVNRMQSIKNANYNRFMNNVKASGLSADAYLALNIINEGFGDASVGQEAYVDSELYKKYQSEINSSMLGSRAVVDKARRDSKQSSLTTYKYAKIGGNVLDIGILIWCAWDVAKLARGAYSLGRGAYSAFRLSRIGSPAQRFTYITQHLPHLQKYSSAGKSIAKFTARVKNGMEPVVLGQRALYTSAPIPKILGAGVENTTVARALATASFDAAKGGYVINAAEAFRAAEGNPGRVADIVRVQNVLDDAAVSAQAAYSSRGFLAKYRSYGSYLSASTKDAFRASGLDSYSLGAGIDFANSLSVPRTLKLSGASVVTPLGVEFKARPLGTSAAPGTFELFHRPSVGMTAAPLPVNISIESKIPTINAKKVTKILLTGEDEIRLSMATGDKFIDPSFFKIGVDNETFINLARLSSEGGTPLTIKFSSRPTGFWGQTKNWFSSSFGSKERLFPSTGRVFVSEGGALRPTSISLAMPKGFENTSLIVRENNTFGLLGAGGAVRDINAPFALSLPKGQLNNFIKYAEMGNFQNPMNLSLTGAKNKLNTLFAVQFLSLSAASTSLVGPLRQNYPDISNSDVALISVVLPYASSFLSPFWAPFVKRFGSANMVKTSLGLAAASLTLPMISGFNGFGDINAMNPNKPSITPLLVSGTLIGLSSSITRASFNPLMDKIGGGVGLLKGMAFKNLSSFAMLAPSLAATTWDAISPRYYTDANGDFLLNDKGERILHSHTDFSLYNPFLLAITGGIFYSFQRAHMPTHIGKVQNYKMANFAKPLNLNVPFMNGINSVYRPVAGTMVETWNATKVLGHRSVWPIALSATAALGVESSILYNYSQAEANKYTGQYVKNDAIKPVVATFTLAVAPFLTRLKSKPIMNMLGGSNNPETYKRLVGISLATAGAGTVLLSQEDNMGMFIPGMALAGIGFANTTNGLLKIGEFNLKAAKVSESVLTGYKVAYPGVHIGMAVFPKLYSSAADSELKLNPDMSKNEALQDNLWIPALTLGGAGLFYAKGSGLMNFNRPLSMPSLNIPTGLLGTSRFLFGTPSSMIRDFRISLNPAAAPAYDGYLPVQTDAQKAADFSDEAEIPAANF